jgi:beta-glucanase (GH16 family)
MEWSFDRIDFFFDGVKYHTSMIDQAGAGEKNCFRKPFYLLINLALGGSWGGEIDDSIFPQKYLIDYVRVYQQRTDAESFVPQGLGLPLARNHD